MPRIWPPILRRQTLNRKDMRPQAGSAVLIDAAALASLRYGVMLVNPGRGALCDSRALIGGIRLLLVA